MSFRRNGKSIHAAEESWETWKLKHAELIAECRLPQGVFRTRKDWNDLILYGYWYDNGYNPAGDAGFHLDQLSLLQRQAFKRLLENTLTDDEKRRGSAGWHFVSPPS
ncbi:MAG: hypothetical protein JNM18_13290 [Planctomycetaceae bacterium]|nr:hypothetical protein [Planctomycetaceae bacterium]